MKRDIASIRAAITGRPGLQRDIAIDERRVQCVYVNNAGGRTLVAGISVRRGSECSAGCAGENGARATDVSNINVVRVQQPVARVALCCVGRNLNVVDIQVVTRGFDLSAVAAQWAGLGFDAAIGPGLAVGVFHIAPQDHFAAVATHGGTGVDGGARVHHHLAGLTHAAAALPVAAHQHGAAAGGAGGVDDARAAQLNVVTFQQNFAALADQAAGFQRARVFNHTGAHLVCGHRRQNDEATRSLHRLAVFNQRGNGGRCGGDTEQVAAALQVQGDAFTGSHDHGTSPRQHHAGVAHFRGQQRNVAAQVGRDVAFVDDLACGAVALKQVLAGHEVVVADAVRCAHQRADVHGGRG